MQTKCPQCGRMTNADHRTCMYCGKIIGEEIVCQKCRRTIGPHQARCMFCGTPRASESPLPKPSGSKLGPNVEIFTPPPGLQGEELLAAMKAKIDQMRTPPPPPQPPSPAADAAMDQALDLFESGATEQALQLLDKAIAAEPRTAKLYLVKGIILSNLKNHRDALVALDNALGLDPCDHMGWFHKADTLDELNRPQEAVPCYDKAIELNPGFVDAWADRGRVMERLSRDDLALVCYAKVLELKPDSAIAWNNRGTVLVRQGQAAKGLKCYEQAVRLDPNLSLAWINQGIAMMRLNKSLRDVANFYLSMLKRYPNHFPAAMKRAQELARGLYYLDCLPLWEVLAALKPQDKNIVSTRNHVRVEAKQEKAQGPKISSLMRRAKTAETAKDRGGALRYYKEILADRVDHLGALLGVARNTLYKPGKDDVLQAWRGALKYHPDNPEALAGQAGAWIDLGRYKEGLAASEWLCKKAPNLATAWLQRGRAFRFLERYAPAAKALRNAVTLDPSLGPAWHELGLVTERLEEWPTVLKAWQCFLEIGEPPGFVDDIRKRRLPKAQKMSGLLEAGAQWDGGQWFEQAHSLEAEKDLDGADLCYTQALRKEPANTAWAVECGLNRITMKHYDRALECAEAILRIHPDNGDALAIKGNSLFRLGEQAITARNYAGGTTDPAPLLSEAAACLQRAAELNNDPGLLQMAGMALALAGKGQEAQSLLTTAPPTPNGTTLSVHISEPQPNLKQVLDAAGKAAAGGTIEQAVTLYDQALTIDPSCLEAMLEKGVGLSMMGRLDAALASFEQATRTAPNNHLPWDHKGTALARAKRGEEALVAFSEALLLSPDEPTVLIHQASTLAQLGRLKEAHDGYRRVLELDAERIDCWAMLGEVEEHLGQPEQALKSYRRYLASPSASPFVLGKLGPHVQKLEGNLRQNQMDDPQNSAELRKGQNLARAGRRDDALKVFNKILTSSPNSSAAAYERGCVQYDLGLLDNAAKSFQYSLNIDDRQIMAWNMLSMCLAQLGQNQNAAEALAKATKLFPEHAATWSNRANALSDLNQHEQALECAERATLLSPNLPQGWGNKGRALAELGRLEEALPAFIQGRRLAPRDPMHAANHALTLAKLGRYQEALPIATQAVQLGPSHPLALQVYQMIISNGR